MIYLILHSFDTANDSPTLSDDVSCNSVNLTAKWVDSENMNI